MKIARLWVLLCLAGMMIGCGQKGPLVLPDTPKHKKGMPAPAPATPAPAPSGASATGTASTPKP